MIRVARRAGRAPGRYARRVGRRAGLAVVVGVVLGALGCGRIGYDAVADAGPDGAIDGAVDGPPAACTAACTPCAPRPFGDDFDDGVLGDAWDQVVDASSSIVEGGGVVTMTAGVEREAWLETLLRYDVEAHPTTVHLVGVDAAPPAADVCLAIRDAAFTFASICVVAGGAELRVAAPGQPAQRQPFVAATMSWWRLSRTGAALRFATSPDGVAWSADTILVGTPALAGATHVRIGVANFSAPPGPAIARFDSWRVGGSPDNLRGQAVGCPPAGWADDFEDGVSPAWLLHAVPGAVAIEEGGAARVAPAPSAAQVGEAGFVGQALFDLRGSAAAIELTSSLSGGDATAHVELRHLGGGDGVAFYLRPPTLYAASIVAYQPMLLGNLPFDPIAHRHLRFRQAGPTTVWEASPDGATWTPVHSADGVLDPRAVELLLSADKYNGPSAGEVRFEAVTLGP